MSETGIKERVRRALAKLGCWTVKVHGEAMQQRGLPDLLVCYQGRFIALELKVPGEEPKRLQAWTLEQIRKAGGVAEAATSVEEAIAVLGRTRPVCISTPIYAFEVTDERNAKADQMLPILVSRCPQDKVIEVLIEIGMESGLMFENGKMRIELTRLQKVAMIAALSAAVEGGLKMSLTDKFRDPNNIEDLI